MHLSKARFSMGGTFVMPCEGLLPPVPQARSLNRGDFTLYNVGYSFGSLKVSAPSKNGAT